jgi:hypothetical protein
MPLDYKLGLGPQVYGSSDLGPVVEIYFAWLGQKRGYMPEL